MKRSYIMAKVASSQMKECSNIYKSMNVIHHMKRTKITRSYLQKQRRIWQKFKIYSWLKQTPVALLARDKQEECYAALCAPQWHYQLGRNRKEVTHCALCQQQSCHLGEPGKKLHSPLCASGGTASWGERGKKLHSHSVPKLALLAKEKIVSKLHSPSMYLWQTCWLGKTRKEVTHPCGTAKRKGHPLHSSHPDMQLVDLEEYRLGW